MKKGEFTTNNLKSLEKINKLKNDFKVINEKLINETEDGDPYGDIPEYLQNINFDLTDYAYDLILMIDPALSLLKYEDFSLWFWENDELDAAEYVKSLIKN